MFTVVSCFWKCIDRSMESSYVEHIIMTKKIPFNWFNKCDAGSLVSQEIVTHSLVLVQHVTTLFRGSRYLLQNMKHMQGLRAQFEALKNRKTE